MGAVDSPQPRAGKGKGKAFRRPKRRVGIRIDMTPMVDVAFLLLIIFPVALFCALLHPASREHQRIWFD